MGRRVLETSYREEVERAEYIFSLEKRGFGREVITKSVLKSCHAEDRLDLFFAAPQGRTQSYG